MTIGEKALRLSFDFLLIPRQRAVCFRTDNESWKIGFEAARPFLIERCAPNELTEGRHSSGSEPGIENHQSSRRRASSHSGRKAVTRVRRNLPDRNISYFVHLTISRILLHSE